MAANNENDVNLNLTITATGIEVVDDIFNKINAKSRETSEKLLKLGEAFNLTSVTSTFDGFYQKAQTTVDGYTQLITRASGSSAEFAAVATTGFTSVSKALGSLDRDIVLVVNNLDKLAEKYRQFGSTYYAKSPEWADRGRRTPLTAKDMSEFTDLKDKFSTVQNISKAEQQAAEEQQIARATTQQEYNKLFGGANPSTQVGMGADVFHSRAFMPWVEGKITAATSMFNINQSTQAGMAADTFGNSDFVPWQKQRLVSPKITAANSMFADKSFVPPDQRPAYTYPDYLATGEGGLGWGNDYQNAPLSQSQLKLQQRLNKDDYLKFQQAAKTEEQADATGLNKAMEALLANRDMQEKATIAQSVLPPAKKQSAMAEQAAGIKEYEAALRGLSTEQKMSISTAYNWVDAHGKVVPEGRQVAKTLADMYMASEKSSQAVQGNIGVWYTFRTAASSISSVITTVADGFIQLGRDISKVHPFANTLAQQLGRTAIVVRGLFEWQPAAFVQAFIEAGSVIIRVADWVLELGHNFVETTLSMSQMGERLGSTAEKYGDYAQGVKLLGGHLKGTTYAFGALNTYMRQIWETGATTGGIFAQLGIQVVDSKGAIRDTTDVMLEMSDVFHAMPDGAQKTAIALQIFNREGGRLVPILNFGSEAIKQMSEWAKKLGYVFDETREHMAYSLKAVQEQVAFLSGSMYNLLSRAAAPVLLEFYTKLRDVLAAFMTTFVDKLGGAENAIKIMSTAMSGFSTIVLAVLPPILNLFTYFIHLVALAASALLNIAGYTEQARAISAISIALDTAAAATLRTADATSTLSKEQQAVVEVSKETDGTVSNITKVFASLMGVVVGVSNVVIGVVMGLGALSSGLAIIGGVIISVISAFGLFNSVLNFTSTSQSQGAEASNTHSKALGTLGVVVQTLKNGFAEALTVMGPLVGIFEGLAVAAVGVKAGAAAAAASMAAATAAAGALTGTALVTAKATAALASTTAVFPALLLAGGVALAGMALGYLGYTNRANDAAAATEKVGEKAKEATEELKHYQSQVEKTGILGSGRKLPLDEAPKVNQEDLLSHFGAAGLDARKSALIKDFNETTNEITHKIRLQQDLVKNAIQKLELDVISSHEAYLVFLGSQDARYAKQRIDLELATAKGLDQIQFDNSNRGALLNKARVDKQVEINNQLISLENIRATKDLAIRQGIGAAAIQIAQAEIAQDVSKQTIKEQIHLAVLAAQKSEQEAIIQGYIIDETRLQVLTQKKLAATNSIKQALIDLQSLRETQNERIALKEIQYEAQVEEAITARIASANSMYTQLGALHQNLLKESDDLDREYLGHKLEREQEITNAVKRGRNEIETAEITLAARQANRENTLGKARIQWLSDLQSKIEGIDALQERLQNRELLRLEAQKDVETSLLTEKINIIKEAESLNYKYSIGYDKQLATLKVHEKIPELQQRQAEAQAKLNDQYNLGASKTKEIRDNTAATFESQSEPAWLGSTAFEAYAAAMDNFQAASTAMFHSSAWYNIAEGIRNSQGFAKEMTEFVALGEKKNQEYRDKMKSLNDQILADRKSMYDDQLAAQKKSLEAQAKQEQAAAEAAKKRMQEQVDFANALIAANNSKMSSVYTKMGTSAGDVASAVGRLESYNPNSPSTRLSQEDLNNIALLLAAQAPTIVINGQTLGQVITKIAQQGHLQVPQNAITSR